MIKIIRNLLQQLIDDIDSGNSNINQDQQIEIIELGQKILSEKLSKQESSNYIGVSVSTFDNYVRKGLIPKGEKRQGFKELSWNKYDLDKYLSKK